MSEQEKIKLYTQLGEAMRRGTQKLFERKAKLGETVIIADTAGQPMEVSADEALKLLNR